MPRKKKIKSPVEHSVTFFEENEVPEIEDALERNRGPWHPSEDEKKDLLWALNRIENEMLPEQEQFHKEWEDAANIVECKITPDPLRESFKIPMSAAIIDAGIAEEIDAFPDFSIDTQEPDDRAKLPFLNAAKKYALWRANWDKVKYEALRIRRIYGFCPVRIYMRRETRKIHQRVPIESDGGFSIKEEEVLDFPWDDICFEVIDNPKRFLIADAKDIESAVDVALVTELDWEAFKPIVQNDRRFKNVEFVQPGSEYRLSMEMPDVEYVTFSRNKERKVTMYEIWSKARDKYLMIVGGVVIRQTSLVDDHKEIPFAVLHMHRRPHTFYSKGIPKLIESIEAAYNAIIQAEVRATKLAFPILVTDDDNSVDPQQIAPYPGVVLEGGLDRIDLKQLGSVPNEVYRLKEKLEEWLIWLTGTNIKQIFSSDSPTNQRVGIEALKKESMLARINANLRENEAGFIVRLGQLLMQDIMQYYPAPKLRRLLPGEDASLLPEDSLVKKDGQIIAVLERRRIPVSGMVLEEVENKDSGLFSVKKISEAGNSSIFARPEYIRTKSMLDIRPIRPSAMGSSKEAKKLTYLELSDHAMTVNQASMTLNAEPPGVDANGKPTPGKPGKPIWNMEYLEAKLAEAHELPPEKALVSMGGEKEKTLAEEFSELTAPLEEIYRRPPPPRPSAAPAAIQKALSPMAQGALAESPV